MIEMDAVSAILLAEETIGVTSFVLYTYLFWASGYMSVMWRMAKMRGYGFRRNKSVTDMPDFSDVFK